MRNRRRPRSAARAVALSLAAAVAAPVAWVAGRLLAHPVLPHAIAAPRRVLASTVGRLSYYEDDGASGLPLVLLHGLSATSSAYEVRALFEALRGERPVLAFDLLGYGFSEKRSEPFTREQHVVAIEEILADVSRRYGATVDVVAIGRGGEVAARAVQRNTRLVRSLALVAPTGFERLPLVSRAVRARASSAFRIAFATPVVGTVVHHLLTTRRLVQAQLRSGTRGRVPEELVRYTYAVSHQPRARVAVLSALVGGAADGGSVVDEVYDVLRVPVLFVDGDASPARERALDALVAQNGRFERAHVEGARALPHVERPFETTQALRAFHRTLSVKPQLRVIRGERVGGVLDPRRRSHVTSLRHA